ncbi:MAG: copper amine oxidase N-terminal domain-containing protein [Firmicutes bacterium]|nr:copper amine oxidase N-terminal domain-containing protein [Bacillota bacterium]
MKLWRKKLALALVLVFVFTCAGPAFASTIRERTQYLYDKVDQFSALNVYSDHEVYSIWVDLNSISSTGSVVTYTYKDSITAPQIGSFTTEPRSIDSAKDKIVRYILGNIANVYRQKPFNTEMTMKTSGLTTIPAYVYGNYKTQAVDEILLGLPSCFDIQYDTSRGRSDPVKPIPMPIIEATLSAIFSLDSTTVTVNNNSTDKQELIEMDVAPEVVGERTFIPVRYLAYALGVPEDGIEWDGTSDTVTITNEETVITLTIDSNIQLVNGEPTEMDATPYVKQIDTGGRTMLPARWVAEPLGATVTWNQESGQMIIKIPQSYEQGQ